MNSITIYQEIKFLSKNAFYIIMQKLGVVIRSIGLTWILAQLSGKALAAGALVLTAFSICTYLTMGTLASISILTAQAKGAGKKEEIATFVRNGFFLAVILSIPLILIFSFAGPILSLLGQQKDIIPIATNYAHFLAWAILPFAFFVILQNFLLGIAEFRLVMVSSILGIIIILILSYILALGKLYFPSLGVSGLGLSAIISFSSVTIYLVLLILLDKNFRSYNVFQNFWKFDKHIIHEIWYIGWPLGAKWAVEIGIFMVIAILIGHKNVNDLAAQQILLQFVLFAGIFAAGTDQATMIRTSAAVGEKNIKQIKLTTKASLSLGLIFSLFVAVFLILFSQQIVLLFFKQDISSVTQVGGIVLSIMPLVLFFQIFDSLRTIATGILAAFKDTKIPFLIEVITFWIIGLFIGYILIKYFPPIKSYWIGLLIGVISCSFSLIFRIKNTIKSIDYKLSNVTSISSS